MNTYGIINNEGIYYDTSFTLRGAKRYATINGYTRVGKRFDCGYHITELSIKINNKWENNDEWARQIKWWIPYRLGNYRGNYYVRTYHSNHIFNINNRGIRCIKKMKYRKI